MNIVPMAEKHISGIALLEKECFSEPWSEEGLSSELTNSQARFFVCEEEGEVLGYMGMHIVLDECYIANVAVYPRHRRKGIGEALVKHCTDLAEKENCCFITLEVRKSNLGAIDLYEKN